MTAYIFKSSLSLIILFGLYWFLLRKQKLFVFNRYFLVLSVVFSLIIPFISIPVDFQVTPRLEYAFPASGNMIPEISKVDNNQQYTEIRPSAIDISAILLTIYVSGVLLFLFRLIRNINAIIRKIKISEKISHEGYRIVLTDDETGPCCFFHSIFLNRDDYLNDRIDKALLDHEKEHVRQSHTIDVMLIELLKIFYWFNPVYLLYDRAIRINHEYLADHGVIGDKSDIKNYADKLLSYATSRSRFSLASNSAYSFTKKRLTMMMKSKSNGIVTGSRIVMTLCIGLILFLLLSFTESKNFLSAPVQSEDNITAFRNDSLININTPLSDGVMEEKSSNIQVNKNLSDNSNTSDQDSLRNINTYISDGYIEENSNTSDQDTLRNIINTHLKDSEKEENSNNIQEHPNQLGNLKTSDQDPVPIMFDTWKVNLRPGITMGQYLDFLKTKMAPEYDKNTPDSKMFIACRGSWFDRNIYAMCYYFKSWKVYYRIHPNATGMSTEHQAVMDRLIQENSKYVLGMERVDMGDLSANWFWDMIDSLQNIYTYK
jgi:beta-lactamase regulating signal transducer with metallopeptidase domain